MKKIIVLMVLILITSGCTNSQKTTPQTSCYCPPCKEECRKQCDDEIAEALVAYQHEIDITEAECLKKANSNADMMRCADKTIDAWLLEIDKNLSILKKILPPEKYALVLNSQTEWRKFQKAEFKTESALIFHKGGTFYYTYSLGEATGVVKDRALQLQTYIDLYSEKH